jgi:hypothetical protein
MRVKITERGYAGHLCVASQCNFRRNTLIEYGDKRIVVSTVGNYNPIHKNKPDTIGINRYYETMAFEAEYIEPYWEANTSKEVGFNSDWAIDRIDFATDMIADAMHEKVVKELSKTIKQK